MVRTMQTAVKSTGGKAPRKPLAAKPAKKTAALDKKYKPRVPRGVIYERWERQSRRYEVLHQAKATEKDCDSAGVASSPWSGST